MGPFWLSGGGFGLDGSWFAFLVFLAALPVIFRLTRDLDYVYNAPVFIPAGMPVDLDAAARSQHEAATSRLSLRRPCWCRLPLLRRCSLCRFVRLLLPSLAPSSSSRTAFLPIAGRVPGSPHGFR